MSDPTPEDVKLARKVACWADAGLEVFRHKLAVTFAAVRAEEREACEKLADAAAAEAREACNRHLHGTPECGRLGVKAHALYMLAKKIRARGEA